MGFGTDSLFSLAKNTGMDGGTLRTATGAVAGIAATAGIAKGAAVIVDRGEVGIRHRFGKEKRYRFGRRKGQVITVGPGVHFQVPLMHSIKKLNSNEITTELKEATPFVPRAESDRDGGVDEWIQMKLGATAFWKLIDNTERVHSPAHPRGKERQFVRTSTMSRALGRLANGGFGEKELVDQDQDPPAYRAMYKANRLHEAVAKTCVNGLRKACESVDSLQVRDDEGIVALTKEITAEKLASYGVELITIAFDDKGPSAADRTGTLIGVAMKNGEDGVSTEEVGAIAGAGIPDA